MKELLMLDSVSMHFPVRKGLLRTEIVKVIDSVSLILQRGETLAIVGESGCGKTTLGRLTLRVLQPTAGRIHFDGHDITSLPEEKLSWFRRRAQAVFQDPYSSLNPFMTVYEILEEPLALHKIGDAAARRERIYESLEDVRLTPPSDFVSAHPHMLSGGQRQRIGIARALMLQPDYVVADEPVSMIDVSSRAEIIALLQELQDVRRISFLYITHDIATAKQFADRIAVMYLGRIVEVGPTSEVIRDPLHPYTVALINAVPEPNPGNRFIERRVASGEPPPLSLVPPGCRFHPRCPRFMAGKCEVIDPPLLPVRPERFVACHLYPS